MVPIAASSRDQVGIMYDQADGFISRALDGDVAARRWAQGFKLHPGYRRIAHLGTHSRIQVWAADAGTGDGAIPTLALIDELHRHKDLRLYRTWAGKLMKRGGQLATISTRGEPGSEFEVALARIRQNTTEVERGETFTRAASSRLVLHEWGVPEGANVEDFVLVKRANPLKAITVQALREKFASKTMELGHWRRFTCNMPTRAENTAITEAEWYRAKTTETIPAGKPLWLGLDVAWKWDTTAMVPLYWREEHFRLLGPATILVPPRDGNALDPDLVERALLEIHKRNPIHTVVMDTKSAEQLGSWIGSHLGATVIDRQQTNSLAVEDYNRFMEALRNGWLKHSGDAGLTQHALNAVAKVLPWSDARFDRPVQGRMHDQERRVIDALVAAAMAHSMAAQMNAAPVAEILVAWA